MLTPLAAFTGGRSKAQSPQPSKSPRSPSTKARTPEPRTSKSPEASKLHGVAATKAVHKATPLSNADKAVESTPKAPKEKKEKKERPSHSSPVKEKKEKSSHSSPLKDSAGKKSSMQGQSVSVKQMKQPKVEIARKGLMSSDSAAGGAVSIARTPAKVSSLTLEGKTAPGQSSNRKTDQVSGE